MRRLAAASVRVVRAARPDAGRLLALARARRYRGHPGGVVVAACLASPHAPVLLVADGPGVTAWTGRDLLARATSIAALVRRTTDEERGGAGPDPHLVLDDAGPPTLVAGIAAAGALGIDVTLVGAAAPRDLAPQVAAERGGLLLRRTTTLPPTRADLLTWAPPSRRGRIRMLTSGTTGRPTAVNREAVPVQAWPTVIDLAAATGIRRGAVTAVAPPLEHGHGFSVLLAALALGSPVLACHGAALLPALRATGARVVTLVPPQLAALLDEHGDAGRPRLPLRSIVTGSAPLPADLAARTVRRFGPVLTDFFGTSENGTATIARPADLARSPGTVGRPALGVRLRVLDDSGRSVRDVVGRLEIDSPWRAAGTPSGFHPTGDLARIDRHGLVHLAGRTGGVVVVGGHNVDVGAVRAWVDRQPELDGAVVTPEPHPTLGTHLVVRGRSPGEHGEQGSAASATPSTLAEVAQRLRERAIRELGSAAAPRAFHLHP